MANQTQIVSSSMGWIGAAGIGAIFFSLVMSWAMNDKYTFAVQRIQVLSDQQFEQIQLYKADIQTYKIDKKNIEDRIELLEIREKRRSENEKN